jgi:hypothetical protein
MKKYIAILLLAFSGSVYAAQTPLPIEKPKDEYSIPIVTYQAPNGQVTFTNTGIPGVTEVTRWLRITILTAALNDAKAVACPSIVDGSVTVSYGLSVGGELVVQIGVDAGLSFTFECEDGKVKPKE